MFDTVGAMYVKVLSDTTGLKDDIERKGGKAGDEAGKSFNRTFQNRLNKELKRGQAFRGLDESITKWAKGMAQKIQDNANLKEIKFDFREVISAKDLKKIRDEFGLTTDEIADYFATRMSGALVGAQKNLQRELAQAAKQAEREAEKVAKAAAKATDGVTKEVRRSWRTSFAEWRKAFKTIEADGKRAATVWGGLSGAVRRVGRDASRLDLDFKGIRMSLRRAGTGGWFDTLTNALAGAIGLAGRLGKIAPAAFSKVGSAIARLGTKFAGSTGVIGQFGNVLVQLGGSLGKLGKGGPAALAAIAVVIGVIQAALGQIVVLVNTLAAGVVALSSALFYAVSNAALLVPIMGALGVGFVGAAIGAVDATQAIGKLWAAVNETDPKAKAAAWDAYNRELAKLGPNARSAVKAMKPLVEQFSDLKKQAGEALFEGMADSLKKAQPLVDAVKKGLIGVAGAVGDVVEGFLGLAQNATFMASFNKMWELSAKIIRDVGSIATDVFAGFTNFFAAISPVVEQFTGKLALVAENFRKWTETKEGQASILQFFQDAYDIGSQVWEVIKNLGLALFDLFTADATKGAAEDLLGFMNTEITKFRDWINEISENGKLQEWFDGAKEVGKALWAVIKDVGKALAGLNTEENREIFKDLMFLIRGVIATFRILAPVGSAALRALLTPIRLVRLAFDAVSSAIEKVLALWRRFRGQRVEGGGGSSWGAPGRALSAMETQVGPTSSLVVNNWNITTPGMDSRVVASQVMNRMAAMAG